MEPWPRPTSHTLWHCQTHMLCSTWEQQVTDCAQCQTEKSHAAHKVWLTSRKLYITPASHWLHTTLDWQEACCALCQTNTLHIVQNQTDKSHAAYHIRLTSPPCTTTLSDWRVAFCAQQCQTNESHEMHDDIRLTGNNLCATMMLGHQVTCCAQC